jgi:hypothetical protein
MLRLRKRASKPRTPRPPDTLTDSAFFGATLAIFLVLAMIAGVGFLGYTALERPRAAVAQASPAVRPALPAASAAAAVREARAR